MHLESVFCNKRSHLNEKPMNYDEEVGAGLLSKKKFMTDMLGYTPEDAENELKQIGEERRTSAVVVDRLFGGME